MPLSEYIERARRLGPVRAAIVDPLDELSLGGAFAAAEAGLIEPVFVGDERAVGEAVTRWPAGKQRFEIHHAPAKTESVEAARLAASDYVKIVVKGALHSDTLLHAMLGEPKLVTGRRLSHVVVTEAPGRERPLLLSDGAVNIAPDLDALAQIVQNAIDVATRLGIEQPRVAILAAVELVESAMAVTRDAASLTEMARRGQITGGIVDGPLALDDALSPAAATVKGIDSPVAGKADVLIAPDLAAGNILFKAFDVLLHARFGAVVTGAKVPIVFTSRADSIDSRVVSCALARLML